MAIKTSKKGQIFNEINITPLTDIFLVLLIIMMVVTPMFQNVDKNIKIPEINNGISVEAKEATVSITKDAQFFLNGTKIMPSQLNNKLVTLVGKAKNKNIVVKADASTKNKEIMKVMRAAQFAGFEKLTVAGEPLTAKQQDNLKQSSKKSADTDNFDDIE